MSTKVAKFIQQKMRARADTTSIFSQHYSTQLTARILLDLKLKP